MEGRPQQPNHTGVDRKPPYHHRRSLWGVLRTTRRQPIGQRQPGALRQRHRMPGQQRNICVPASQFAVQPGGGVLHRHHQQAGDFRARLFLPRRLRHLVQFGGPGGPSGERKLVGQLGIDENHRRQSRNTPAAGPHSHRDRSRHQRGSVLPTDDQPGRTAHHQGPPGSHRCSPASHCRCHRPRCKHSHRRQWRSRDHLR